MEGEREADGDEGLGRVAKPLTGGKKKIKTLWIHCVERQGIKGEDKEAVGNREMETVAGDGVTGAGRERKPTKRGKERNRVAEKMKK